MHEWAFQCMQYTFNKRFSINTCNGYSLIVQLLKLKNFKNLPNTIFLAYAHTSIVSLANGFMTQWYCSFLGSLHWVAKAVQFFFSAAFFHFSKLSGQSLTICTVFLDIGHESILAFNTFWMKYEIFITIAVFYASY